MAKKSNITSLENRCSRPAMREEFSDWVVQGENLLPAEVRYFIKCMRMEIERQRENMSEYERTYSDECELSLAHMEREMVRAWEKTILKLAEKVYEDKATRLRFLSQETA